MPTAHNISGPDRYIIVATEPNGTRNTFAASDESEATAQAQSLRDTGLYASVEILPR